MSGPPRPAPTERFWPAPPQRANIPNKPQRGGTINRAPKVICCAIWPPPAVQKNARSAPPHRLWPVPIGDQHQIIERIGAAQHLVAMRIGRAHHQIVILIARVIRPQITGPDRHRPIGGPRHAVRTIQEAHDAMFALRRCPIPLSLARRHPATPQGAGIAPPAKPQAKRGENQIIGRHALFCPIPFRRQSGKCGTLPSSWQKILKPPPLPHATAESGKMRAPTLYWGKDRGNEPCDI